MISFNEKKQKMLEIELKRKTIGLYIPIVIISCEIIYEMLSQIFPLEPNAPRFMGIVIDVQHQIICNLIKILRTNLARFITNSSLCLLKSITFLATRLSLCMYEGRQFVYEIPNHGASCDDLGTTRKPSIIMVHQIDFIMFQHIVEKLLTIEQIFNENLFK